MTRYKQQNGIYLPVEKEKPVKRNPPKVWNCRHCGIEFDSTKQENEAYTVGNLNPESIPHIRCPHCKECMGCLEKGR